MNQTMNSEGKILVSLHTHTCMCIYFQFRFDYIVYSIFRKVDVNTNFVSVGFAWKIVLEFLFVRQLLLQAFMGKNAASVAFHTPNH